MIAFAKLSGLKEILKELKNALESDFKARFVIGLDFYQTDPELLTNLLNLSKKYNLSLFISNSEYCFHPKIYAFKNKKDYRILVGSANLTSGGLHSNHEISALIEDKTGEFFISISKLIDNLIETEEVIPATKESIALYKKNHSIYKIQQSLATRRIRRATHNNDVNFDVLRDILIEMKLDKSEGGFDKQQTFRELSRHMAISKMNEIIYQSHITPESFITLYEPLASELWHSGGLERGKNIISLKAALFQDGLKSVTNLNEPSATLAYQTLHNHFVNIQRAGTNVITEALHTIDNNKFSVMNKNSVYGMSLANINGFPESPSKKTVNAEMYSKFCIKSKEVCSALGLSNFTELDALFNYAYWD